MSPRSIYTLFFILLKLDLYRSYGFWFFYGGGISSIKLEWYLGVQFMHTSTLHGQGFYIAMQLFLHVI